MIYSKTRFLGLFTDYELALALETEKTNPAVAVTMERMRNASDIDTESAAVIAGINALQAYSVITEDRKLAILGSQSGLGMHNLTPLIGTTTTFICTFCNAQITFSELGLGEPSVDALGNPPADPEQWMGPCV